MVQYGRPTEELERSIRGIWVALGIGVLAGSLLALIAGLFVARRMLRPLAALTDAAREVSNRGDTTVSIPVPAKNDEVRDLAETLREALHELDAARSEAELLLARQRDFVADASHELRTPLTSLIANLEMLVSSSTGESRIDADAALRSSRRMSQLVSDLLLLARADGKKTRFESLDLERIAREAVAEITPLLEARTLNAHFESVRVDGEEVALFRAIRNLLDNAVTHTPDGTTIDLNVSEQDGNVRISVEDSGPGIPESETDQIFDRFVRGHSVTTSGTGLGLSIVSAVAAAHSGKVRAHRSKLGGAGFEIVFPVNQVSTTTGTTMGRRRS
jgi:signal transduction histidine kinase